MPVIKTKLMVPPVKEGYIRRARLSAKMKAVAEYPLCIVESGAGYGKSTALALFVHDEKLPCSWYSISSEDDDIIPFLSCLVASVRLAHPDFGTEILSILEQLDRYVKEEEIRSLASLFINEAALHRENILLILDDFHQVEHSYTINCWMETLLEHIPPNLHLIISSRSRPGWKLLKKMRVTDKLLEIKKEDLVLSRDEVELLLNELYGISIKQGDLDRICLATEGWVIAVGMIGQQLTDKKSISNLFGASSGSLADLFQYLVTEVFAKQPPLIQQFLEQTSIFDDMTEELCDEVLGIAGAGAMLQQLTEKNLFIHKIGEKVYRYHALFKEFLEKQLKAGQPNSYRLLNERCARHFVRSLQWDDALKHFEKIGSTEEIASILSDQGLRMLETGKLGSLSDRIAGIPGQTKDRFYPVWFLEGEVLRYRSSYQEAELAYDRAATGADGKKDLIWKARALEGKARIYLDTIQPHKAERILSQAIQLKEGNIRGGRDEPARLYHLLAENLINAGQAAKAEKWMERAESMGHQMLDKSLLARLYLRTGKLTESRKILMSGRKTESEGKPLPKSHRETDLLLALIEAFTGNGAEAKKLSQEGIQQGISTKAPFVEACGWIRLGHAAQLLGEYDSALAEKCYRTSLDIMDRLEIERGKAEPLMGLCILYGERNDYSKSMDAGKAGLQETERVKDMWLSSLILISMGISSAYGRRFGEADKHFDLASSMLQQCGDDYGCMLALFWKAYSAHQQGLQEDFEHSFKSFLSQMQWGDYEFFLFRRTLFGPRDLQMFAPILIEAEKSSIMPDYTARLLKEMNLGNLHSHPGFTLKVKTLGQFRVWLGDKEIDEGGWQRGKAKELLQLFLTHLHQLIRKEDIFDMLWPEQDAASADRDFKVALNALNNVLEPNRKPRKNPFFISREGTSYGINPKAVIDLDSILFEEWIKDGLEEKDHGKSIHRLERALKLYAGDYLPERRYEDWCISEKERLQVYFLRGAEKLAQLCVRKEDYDMAIEWCERIIEKDRTWEEAYRLLMYCYYSKNNRPRAIRWFQKCCEVLEEELGVAPLEPTLHMHEMIMESGNVAGHAQW
ncbi:BTAD domain-containing putative transcriptional regulator [Bacillus infantis]|uniref:BTAD domain-containing putative transcriptional regulator n=1 Tax=Bacillus infantis TaxID=324767 RepID=UPI003CF4B830